MNQTDIRVFHDWTAHVHAWAAGSFDD